jgi:hypothetical protein
MDGKNQEIVARIERCRRIAQYMTDDEVRHSLEDLAEEYEAQLPGHDNVFMLGNGEDDEQAGSQP